MEKGEVSKISVSVLYNKYENKISDREREKRTIRPEVAYFLTRTIHNRQLLRKRERYLPQESGGEVTGVVAAAAAAAATTTITRQVGFLSSPLLRSLHCIHSPINQNKTKHHTRLLKKKSSWQVMIRLSVRLQTKRGRDNKKKEENYIYKKLKYIKYV